MYRLAGTILLALLFFNSTFAQIDKEKLKEPLKELSNGVLMVEDFEGEKVGELPSRWYNRDVKQNANDPKEAKKYHYTIEQENGNKFLHYEHTDARHLNFPLLERKNVNIHETPILSWKWRVNKLPEGGNEDKEPNDVAASIYVAYNMGRVALFKKVPKSIRYTWSSTLPKGKEMSKFFGNQKIVVVESGEDEMGKWIRFERNIKEDYERMFGDEAPKIPMAILLLSDADQTNSTAIADYDDIMLKPAE
ncbi:MAG: DUF3047 domain-containing protein [Gracilimonas sp.]|nr:DUF3047 domain-containing protein [Gracilimonas sp.]